MTETLYIDVNEPADVQQAVIEEIKSRSDINLDIEIEGLKTGDFLLGDLVIERKEASDLAGSITDGRLREQTGRISADFQHGYILLEGNPYDLKYSNLHPNSIVGSLVSTNSKKGIDIIPVDDKDSLAYAIYKICRVHLNGEEFNAEEYKLKRSGAETEDIQIAMLSQINGISKEKAEKITSKYYFRDGLAGFGSEIRSEPKKIENDLQMIDGIGEKLSQRVIESFK